MILVPIGGLWVITLVGHLLQLQHGVLLLNIEGSFNGRTLDFESGYIGSIPIPSSNLFFMSLKSLFGLRDIFFYGFDAIFTSHIIAM
jgi:hypothetical protein